MKSMDFFARLGADPQSHLQCDKGMQRRMAEKDAISCIVFGETDYQPSARPGQAVCVFAKEPPLRVGHRICTRQMQSAM